MNKEMQFKREKPQDPDDKMEIEFVDFVEKNKFTAEQFER